MAKKTYRLIPVTDGSEVKGGLSYANGSCAMVTRLPDGRYTLADSKLGSASPVWILTADQFRRLGDFFIWLSSWAGAEASTDLGGGALLTIRRTYPGSVFSLAGEPDLSFTGTEILAFTWGFMYGQWPEGQPVQRFEFA